MCQLKCWSCSATDDDAIRERAAQRTLRRTRESRCVSYCDFYWKTLVRGNALGGAAPLRKYRTLESDFWDGFDGGAVVPLGSQQPIPAMCQAQPKLSIVFVMRVRREFSALLDLVLEEIGCFDHAITTTKAPLTGASIDKKRNNSVFVPRDQRKRGHPIEQPRRIRIRCALGLPAIAQPGLFNLLWDWPIGAFTFD